MQANTLVISNVKRSTHLPLLIRPLYLPKFQLPLKTTYQNSKGHDDQLRNVHDLDGSFHLHRFNCIRQSYLAEGTRSNQYSVPVSNACFTLFLAIAWRLLILWGFPSTSDRLPCHNSHYSLNISISTKVTPGILSDKFPGLSQRLHFSFQDNKGHDRLLSFLFSMQASGVPRPGADLEIVWNAQPLIHFPPLDIREKTIKVMWIPRNNMINPGFLEHLQIALRQALKSPVSPILFASLPLLCSFSTIPKLTFRLLQNLT